MRFDNLCQFWYERLEASDSTIGEPRTPALLGAYISRCRCPVTSSFKEISDAATDA